VETQIDFLRDLLVCFGILMPIAFLGLNFQYRFAQKQVSRLDQVELAKQYRILLACFCFALLILVTGSWLIGAVIGLLLIYLACRVIRYQLTIIPASGLGARGLKGRAALLSAFLYIGWTLLLFILAFAPFISRANSR
jgi:hypothetical protein